MHPLKNKEKLINKILIGVVIIAIAIYFVIRKDAIIAKLDLNFFESGNYSLILKGLKNTFLITIVGFVIGVLVGFIVCLIQGSKSQNSFMLVLKQISKFYVQLFRGTPVAVQLLIIYYIIFSGFSGDPLYVAMIAFGLNSGAYVSEIIRGGINAVSSGQMEAGRSLGLSYRTVMMKIIFPQALKNALPSLGNEFITLIKETSIAGFIGALDLTLSFRKIANATYDYETVYLVMGICYFAIVLLITFVLSKIEKRLLKDD